MVLHIYIYTPWKKYSSLPKHFCLFSSSIFLLIGKKKCRFVVTFRKPWLFHFLLIIIFIIITFLQSCDTAVVQHCATESGGRSGVVPQTEDNRPTERSAFWKPPPTSANSHRPFLIHCGGSSLLEAPLAGLHVNAASRCQKMQVQIRLQFLAGCWQMSGKIAESRLAPGRESSRRSSCSRAEEEEEVEVHRAKGWTLFNSWNSPDGSETLGVSLTLWNWRCIGEGDEISRHRHTHICECILNGVSINTLNIQYVYK